MWNGEFIVNNLFSNDKFAISIRLLLVSSWPSVCRASSRSLHSLASPGTVTRSSFFLVTRLPSAFGLSPLRGVVTRESSENDERDPGTADTARKGHHRLISNIMKSST